MKGKKFNIENTFKNIYNKYTAYNTIVQYEEFKVSHYTTLFDGDNCSYVKVTRKTNHANCKLLKSLQNTTHTQTDMKIDKHTRT